MGGVKRTIFRRPYVDAFPRSVSTRWNELRVQMKKFILRTWHQNTGVSFHQKLAGIWKGAVLVIWTDKRASVTSCISLGLDWEKPRQDQILDPGPP
jgi:hypothetical protein